MIKFQVRPALTTKSMLDFCQMKGISVPEEYTVFKGLLDFDLTNASSPIRLLEYLSKHENVDATFFEQLFYYSAGQWLIHLKPILSQSCDKSIANQIYDFFINMVGVRTNLDWRLQEDDEKLAFIVNSAYGSVYEELILYHFFAALLARADVGTDEVEIKFAKEMESYNQYDFLPYCHFNNDRFELTVAKYSVSKMINPLFLNRIMSDYDLLIAACNMIPVSELNVTSLSFILSMSKRTLTKYCEEMGISLKTVINHVKYKRAKRLLVINDGNVKATACDCGYTDQGRISKIFRQISGQSPSEYYKEQQDFLFK
ncbi:helix-turn-helix transcriptional regulator [Shewanella intestini]|uniref:Helix-turn-helix transcriptional regulator n=1 Tax=Shewanella intestini TaxID=2017544 RepID=A0ABS5I6D9_9GAMM|nr:MULTISPECIES: helix-turn-helix transcriptional regulator [Shewanella]MBR9729593.1 helix-turn-helix transcriptional regulator [Shewanella intestini]MRG37547.1 helix-turn-helix domain-containing protein [Shewanella sp. XMDDZSB0408]